MNVTSFRILINQQNGLGSPSERNISDSIELLESAKADEEKGIAVLNEMY
jgi:hypothetical protein